MCFFCLDRHINGVIFGTLLPIRTSKVGLALAVSDPDNDDIRVSAPIQGHSIRDVDPEAWAATGGNGKLREATMGSHGSNQQPREDKNHGKATELPKTKGNNLTEPLIEGTVKPLPVVVKEPRGKEQRAQCSAHGQMDAVKA
jgi:hypothetical protein